MPTPRSHGGAQLAHLPLNVPAFRGLNSEFRGALLGPDWATRLENTVFDLSNRIANRKGWQERTASAAAADITQIIEFLNGSASELYAVAGSAMLKSTDAGATFTDVTGGASVSDTGMQLIQFRNTVLGFQDGAAPVVLSGGSFINGSVNAPQTNVAHAAFGRIWAKDTATSLKYCALLDETDWTGSDSGGIDLTSVWPFQDEITAISSFSGLLVIFSKRNVVLYDDSTGSAIGLDPIDAVVKDVISGIGCVARDSVVNVKGDLWFLDDSGVHSLGRLVNTESNPILNLTKNVQSDLQTYISLTDLSKVKAVYDVQERFYLLSLPRQVNGAEVGRTFCIDTRAPMDDGSMRVPGVWTQLVPNAIVYTDSRELLMSCLFEPRKLGKYAGTNDNGNGYVFEYESGWTDLGSPDIKILKSMSGIMFVQGAVMAVHKWAFDFAETFESASVEYEGGLGISEYGSGLYGVSGWGSGVSLQEESTPGSGQGEHVRLGVSIPINDNTVAIQQLSLLAKIGRLHD